MWDNTIYGGQISCGVAVGFKWNFYVGSDGNFFGLPIDNVCVIQMRSSQVST